MRETAEALDISLSATKARLFHAKKALRRSAIQKLVKRPRFAAKLSVLHQAVLGRQTPGHGFSIRSSRVREEKEISMSSKSKGHQNVESQATSAPQGEAVHTSASDSPRLEEIRIRAYEIYIERGGQPGHDVDDWLQAERELEPKARPANAGQ